MSDLILITLLFGLIGKERLVLPSNFAFNNLFFGDNFNLLNTLSS